MSLFVVRLKSYKPLIEQNIYSLSTTKHMFLVKIVASIRYQQAYLQPNKFQFRT